MITLVEAMKHNEGDVVRAGVIEMFARASDVLRVMPFRDIPGGSYHYTQEGSMPGVGFRGVNQTYTESTGIVNPQVEVLRIAGGNLDCDRAIIKMHGPGARSWQEFAKVKALALFLQKKLIKGDSLVDVREFDGLQNRITGSQLIEAGTTDGGDALSLLKLDELCDAVDDPTHLIMSKAIRRLLSAAARTTTVGGFIVWEKNEFGKKIAFYNELPILLTDIDETGSRVLDFNEVGGTGATATATSIYCVAFGEGMLMGLQNGVMEVEDLGRVSGTPILRTEVEWLVGLAALHARCAGRLRGVKNVAVVA